MGDHPERRAVEKEDRPDTENIPTTNKMRGVMRKTMLLVGVLLLGACGGGEDGAPKMSAESDDLLINTVVVGATTPGAEPIATGEVAEGSTLGGSPFCVGGTIRDTHGSTDPEVALIARTITCPEGSLRMDITPEVSQEMRQDLTQTGSWQIVGGTGEFEGLRGSGNMEAVYDPDPHAPARGTYTGTVTR
jgi:hypothetical protein